MNESTTTVLLAQAAPTDTSPWANASDAAAAMPSPWDTAAAPAAAASTPPGADAWGVTTPTPDPAAASGWLDAPAGTADALASQAGAAGHHAGFALHQLWDGSLPIEAWINHALAWVVENFRPFFQSVRVPIDGTLDWVQSLLTSIPSLAMIALLGVLA